MAQEITLTLKRVDAEALVKSLQHRKQKLCDIRRELCKPEPSDELEREELAYFEEEDAVVERVMLALRAVLARASVV